MVSPKMSILRRNPSPLSRATETVTAGRKRDARRAHSTRVVATALCRRAACENAPTQRGGYSITDRGRSRELGETKQKAPRVSPRGFCFLALADLSAASRPACAKHTGRYFSL